MNRNDTRLSNHMITVENHGDMTIRINVELARQMIIEAEAKQFPDISKLKYKREMGLAKVRARIHAKEEAKRKEEEDKLEEERKASMLNMSEDARRGRAYAWYSRMAMPTRDAMKERVARMPTSAGVLVEDVDLLPWTYNDKLVNVEEMQNFINDGDWGLGLRLVA
jgi:hypothetical protein